MQFIHFHDWVLIWPWEVVVSIIPILLTQENNWWTLGQDHATSIRAGVPAVIISPQLSYSFALYLRCLYLKKAARVSLPIFPWSSEKFEENRLWHHKESKKKKSFNNGNVWLVFGSENFPLSWTSLPNFRSTWVVQRWSQWAKFLEDGKMCVLSKKNSEKGKVKVGLNCVLSVPISYHHQSDMFLPLKRKDGDKSRKYYFHTVSTQRVQRNSCSCLRRIEVVY